MNAPRVLRPGVLREVGRLVAVDGAGAEVVRAQEEHARASADVAIPEWESDGQRYARKLLERQQFGLGVSSIADESPSEAPEPTIVRGADPVDVRGERFDDVRWCSSDTVTAIINPALITPIAMQSQQVVHYTCWPPRAVALALICTLTSTNLWDLTANNFTIAYELSFGLGSGVEIIQAISVFAGGGGVGAAPRQIVTASPLAFLPVRELNIRATLTGTPTVGGSFVARFFAAAAPFTIEGRQG